MAAKDFAPVFRALRSVLARHEKQYSVKVDNAAYYYLETKRPVYKGRPMGFAAVRIGKGYVSYHLVPVYMNERLSKTISPALKKRMQGKGCFNFTETDAALFKELRALTDAGAKCFEAICEELSSAQP
jgi:hypothetical protein